ncbi:protein IQ-DOMAIN 14-like [Chenopodium quinoa]|nr:protein IQ-DOMAIN 14-like [Chenopodium quinoa]
MQAIFRVQARVCDQRRRLSISRESSLSSSSFTDKIPLSKDGEWDEFQSVEKEIDSSSILGMTQEDVWKSERDLAYAFSDKMWKSRMKESDEIPDGAVDWREAIRWERPGRYSCDQRHPIKLHQVENANRRSSFHKIREKNPYQQIKLSPYSAFQTPIKPYQPELKHLQVHSASPRCMRQQEPIYLKSQTPRLSCSYRNNTAVPSYMADTASAKARIRSQSVPREQRPSTPEREGIGIPKRRLFFGSSEEVASPSCRNTPRVQR